MKLKNKITILLFLFGLVASSQNIKLNIAPVNIYETVPRIVELDFEDYLKKFPGLEAGLGYYFAKPNYSGDGEYEGVRIRLSYKIYFNKDVKYQGLFLSPSIY